MSRIKPDADKTQKVRAVAVDKLGVVFPSDIPQAERTETLVTYQGSLWYLESRASPASFRSVEWPYFGL